MQTPTAEVVLERMVRAVEKVRERLLRATAALEAAGVQYAVTGDQAVAAWVASVDKSAVRHSPEVEILIRRADLMRARDVLESTGFSYKVDRLGPLFLDRPHAPDRDSVRILLAGEKARSTDLLPDPDVDKSVTSPPFKSLNLGPLVLMCLSSFRNLDNLRIRDLIDVGLVGQNWLELLSHYPQELTDRLRTILANPES
jgi:hypothetical protein